MIESTVVQSAYYLMSFGRDADQSLRVLSLKEGPQYPYIVGDHCCESKALTQWVTLRRHAEGVRLHNWTSTAGQSGGF
jgi:hypothetical protein